jgi:hypothetical protein
MCMRQIHVGEYRCALTLVCLYIFPAMIRDASCRAIEYEQMQRYSTCSIHIIVRSTLVPSNYICIQVISQANKVRKYESTFVHIVTYCTYGKYGLLYIKSKSAPSVTSEFRVIRCTPTGMTSQLEHGGEWEASITFLPQTNNIQ